MPLRSVDESLQTGSYVQPTIDNFAGGKTRLDKLSAWIRSLPLPVLIATPLPEPRFEYAKVLPDITNGLVADNVFLSGPIFPVNQLRSNRDAFSRRP